VTSTEEEKKIYYFILAQTLWTIGNFFGVRGVHKLFQHCGFSYARRSNDRHAVESRWGRTGRDRQLNAGGVLCRRCWGTGSLGQPCRTAATSSAAVTQLTRRRERRRDDRAAQTWLRRSTSSHADADAARRRCWLRPTAVFDVGLPVSWQSSFPRREMR